jgi:transposase
LVNSEDFPEKITLMSSSYSVSYYTSSTAKPEEPKIVIILDNASIHKKKEFLEKIKEKMPNLIIEFLPEYSPDYNLIELVWHSAKEFIANRLFKSIEELEELLNRLLNQGELVRAC